MADINLTVTIPDPRMDDLVDALRHEYGKKGDGTDYSLAELRGREEAAVLTRWKKLYRKFIKETADQADLTS